MDSRKQQGYDNGVIYMDNKKKFAAICIGVLILAASVGTTLAYLGATANKENKIKVGTDVAAVREPDWSEPSIQESSNDYNKTITVKNEGTVPCFVRVYAEFSDSEIANLAHVVDGKDVDRKWEGTGSTDFKTYFADSHDDENWVFIPDSGSENAKLNGYFYYKKALQVDDPSTTEVEINAVTTPLIKQVKVNYNSPNIDVYRDYEMIVYTETVQTVDTDTGTDFATDTTNGWINAWKAFLLKEHPTPTP